MKLTFNKENREKRDRLYEIIIYIVSSETLHSHITYKHTHTNIYLHVYSSCTGTQTKTDDKNDSTNNKQTNNQTIYIDHFFVQ